MKKDIDLKSILKELYNISGFRISIHDTDFNEVEAYPKDLSYFCNFIRKNHHVTKLCQKTDKEALLKVQKTQEIYLYKCHLGLYEAVVPLYAFGKLTGYLMMGQTIDSNEESVRFIFRTASNYTKDTKALKEAVNSIPHRSKEQILSCTFIMEICATYLTLSNHINKNDSDLSKKARDYIDQNFSDKITINILCTRFFCSRSTLINVFKKSYGLTINEYINYKRIEYAKELLIKTSKPINIVAVSSGFIDQNYFTKVFLKKVGLTPSMFRKNSKHLMF